VATQFSDYVQLNPRIPDELLTSVLSIERPSQFVDTVAAHIICKVQVKQQFLDCMDLASRFRALTRVLNAELEILQIERRIEGEIKSQVEKTHKERYLTERLKAIRKELGHEEVRGGDVEDLAEAIEKCGMSREARDVAYREFGRLAKMSAASPEASVVRTYLEVLSGMPWKKTTRDRLDLTRVRKQLDGDHHGLEQVKERILEYLAVLKLTRSIRGPILCLVGPPGVGKTSLGRSVATALGRQFVRLSLGGVRDEAEIRGHRRTYVGAMPGRILQSLRKCASRNPVFVLDEIDKLGADFRGDPSAALLEALDPEQNHAFSDHYLEVGFDLSKVLFVTTANVLHTIPQALQDRLEIIQLPGYLDHDKVEIAQRFLLPKQREQHGLDAKNLELTTAAVEALIHRYTRESGVRGLERQIGRLCRKVARSLAEEPSPRKLHRSARNTARRGKQNKTKRPARPAQPARHRLDAPDLEQWLSVAPFLAHEVPSTHEVGVATGLARTATGGKVLPVEVTVMRGSGQLILTGQLGDVMKESARTALSYVRSVARRMRIRAGTFERHDVHIHVPDGAIPKDGPSAGIAIATALASVGSQTPVDQRVGMTGEITLRGKVLPVGGLAEKCVAALRAGVHTVLVPQANAKEIGELPDHVRESLEVVLVESMDEVLEVAFQSPHKRGGAGARQRAASDTSPPTYTH
jgi:ATP-dependent Lon protease